MRLIEKIKYIFAPSKIGHRLWNFVILKKHGVKIDIKDILGMNGRIFIYGDRNTISIGRGFVCNSGKTKNPIGGNTQLIFNSMGGSDFDWKQCRNFKYCDLCKV